MVVRRFVCKSDDHCAYFHILSPPGMSVMNLMLKSLFNPQTAVTIFDFSAVFAMHIKVFALYWEIEKRHYRAFPL